MLFCDSSGQGGPIAALTQVRRRTLMFVPVTVEMHNTGDPALQMEVRAMVEHVLADRPGDWRISIIGTQASDQWDMKIHGPNAFERSYTLEGAAGQHEPRAIASIVSRMVPR